MVTINHDAPAFSATRRLISLSAQLTVLAALSLLVAACGSGGSQPAASDSGGQARIAVTQTQSDDIQSQITKVPVEGGGNYFDVSVAGLATMLKAKDFPMINVHIPYEGEIEPTDAFIPYNEIEQNIGKLPTDKGARIVLYCRSGSMSATAARVLAKQGYANVYNLDGGMIAWKASGYPLADKQR